MPTGSMIRVHESLRILRLSHSQHVRDFAFAPSAGYSGMKMGPSERSHASILWTHHVVKSPLNGTTFLPEYSADSCLRALISTATSTPIWTNSTLLEPKTNGTLLKPKNRPKLSQTSTTGKNIVRANPASPSQNRRVQPYRLILALNCSNM
jgi:hypothetical protein